MRQSKGFTLMEFLIVIGVITIVVAIMLVTIDPARRFAEARNAQRWSSVNSMLTGYLNYMVENHGAHPISNDTDGVAVVPGTAYGIGNGTSTTSCKAVPTEHMKHVSFDQLVGTYIPAVPIDPRSGSGDSTGFYYTRMANGRVTIGACDAERGETIAVQRW